MIDREARQAVVTWDPEPVGLTRHETAVRRSLARADAAAERLDYTAAAQWLATIEANGDQLSHDYADKRREWLLAARERSVRNARRQAVRRPSRDARAGTIPAAEASPSTKLLGRCFGCGDLVFDRHVHEWATRDSHELCWPLDADAALFCARCSTG